MGLASRCVRSELTLHWTRLKVPKVRSFLEYANFLVLFILYVIAVEGLEEERLNGKELAFIIYALGKLHPSSLDYN